VGQVIYGAPDPKRGASLHTPSLFHPKTQVRTGILEQECREWMERFFRKLRF
jgi:tRNA(adenine34) deaminase